MIGILNLDKPRGMTSRDVVNRVQQIVRPAKCGHAGTLDPLATGVLVVCVGRATRLIEYVQQQPKRYRGEFLLGRTSETEDIEGNVTELENPPQPAREELAALLPRFTGAIDQRPPAFSALKVGGKRAYQLARRGEAVELRPRKVSVHELRIVEYDYPRLVVDVACGGGTYIRSLGRDLARAAGTDAVMSALTRTAIGEFSLDGSCPLNELTADSLPGRLYPAEAAVRHLPPVTLSDDQIRKLSNGAVVELPSRPPAGELAVFSPNGHFVAVAEPRGNSGIKAKRFIGETG